MAAISRTQAIQQITSALAGYDPNLIRSVVSSLSLPGRVSQTEIIRYLETARSRIKQAAIRGGGQMPPSDDPRQSAVAPVSSGADSRMVRYIGDNVTTPGQTTAERAASAISGQLVQPFIDGGWENPDYWAKRFLDYSSPYMANAPEKWLEQNQELIESTARRFGKNPELAWQFFTGNFTPPPTDLTTITIPEEGGDGYGFNPFGSSGGSGAGRAAPVYVPPDRRDVEDMVRGQLARLVGQADPTRLQTLTDLYMTEHRRSWDNPALGLNPAASVTEQVRATSDFKRIHTLRPDFVDEDEWVTMYQQGGVQQGLTAGEAEQFAIEQATIGTRTTSIAAAAASRAFVQSGAEVPEFVNRARGAAKNLMQGVR